VKERFKNATYQFATKKTRRGAAREESADQPTKGEKRALKTILICRADIDGRTPIGSKEGKSSYGAP